MRVFISKSSPEQALARLVEQPPHLEQVINQYSGIANAATGGINRLSGTIGSLDDATRCNNIRRAGPHARPHTGSALNIPDVTSTDTERCLVVSPQLYINLD